MLILVIDDEAGLRRSLGAYLEDLDHEVAEAANGQEGLDVLNQRGAEISAVVVDLNMPVMDGYSFIQNAVRLAPELPIVVLSGVGVVDDALRAMRMGAWDFITKPLHNLGILEHTLGKVLDRARLMRENRSYQENLEHLVQERTKEVERTRMQVMQRLSRAAEYKDNETGRHVIRVGKISGVLARALGLTPDRCKMVRACAPLHDVGKIGIPDSVLLKPGRLDAEEWKIMREHCVYGCEILGPLTDKRRAREACLADGFVSDLEDNELLAMARAMALCHHERWDGCGYPLGLSGEDIPIEARIVSVVDVYDALKSDRPYKKAFSQEECIRLLREGSGTQFDPTVLEAFFTNEQDIADIYDKWRD